MNEFEIKDGVLIKYNGTASQVVIPAGVREIGRRAFASHRSLREVRFEENGAPENAVLTKIGLFAFSDCPKLCKLELPWGLREIGCCAFSNCKSLKSITLPARLTLIQSEAFSGCVNLKQILFLGPSAPLKIEWKAFANCKKLKSIALPVKFNLFAGHIFSGCKHLAHILFEEPPIPPQTPAGDHFLLDGVIYTSSLSYDTFADCPGLKTVTVPPHLSETAEKFARGYRVIVK